MRTEPYSHTVLDVEAQSSLSIPMAQEFGQILNEIF